MKILSIFSILIAFFTCNQSVYEYTHEGQTYLLQDSILKKYEYYAYFEGGKDTLTFFFEKPKFTSNCGKDWQLIGSPNSPQFNPRNENEFDIWNIEGYTKPEKVLNSMAYKAAAKDSIKAPILRYMGETIIILSQYEKK